jgi:hypothetical protein
MLNDIKKFITNLRYGKFVFIYILGSEKIVSYTENFYLKLKQNVCSNLAGCMYTSMDLI